LSPHSDTFAAGVNSDPQRAEGAEPAVDSGLTTTQGAPSNLARPVSYD